MAEIFKRHGWTCRECGAYNSVADYNCDNCDDIERAERRAALKAQRVDSTVTP